MLEDPLQNARPCDLWTFSNIFLRKPFFPNENSKIQSYKKLTINAIKTLLHERFRIDQERNEQLINECIRQKQINMMWGKNDWPAPITNLSLSNIGDFGQVLALWGKKTVTKDRKTKHFLVKPKLLYVK